MPDPRHVSPCCGAECLPNPLYGDGRVECPGCHSRIQPLPADVRQRIKDEGRAEGIKEGMERAAKIAKEKGADYECDWSSPEFNYAENVVAAIRAAVEEVK